MAGGEEEGVRRQLSDALMILLKRELYDDVLHFQLVITAATVTLAALLRGKSRRRRGLGAWPKNMDGAPTLYHRHSSTLHV
jgi:hypothetical protein